MTRPVIRLEPGERCEIADRVTALLVDSKLPIFRRDGVLVLRFAPAGCNDFAKLLNVGVRRLMDRVARFEKFDGRSNTWTPINAPSSIASIIMNNPRAFPEYPEDGAS